MQQSPAELWLNATNSWTVARLRIRGSKSTTRGQVISYLRDQLDGLIQWIPIQEACRERPSACCSVTVTKTTQAGRNQRLEWFLAFFPEASQVYPFSPSAQLPNPRLLSALVNERQRATRAGTWAASNGGNTTCREGSKGRLIGSGHLFLALFLKCNYNRRMWSFGTAVCLFQCYFRSVWAAGPFLMLPLSAKRGVENHPTGLLDVPRKNKKTRTQLSTKCYQILMG